MRKTKHTIEVISTVLNIFCKFTQLQILHKLPSFLEKYLDIGISAAIIKQTNEKKKIGMKLALKSSSRTNYNVLNLLLS